MKNLLTFTVLGTIATIGVQNPAFAANIVTTLGEQDFTDGSYLSLSEYKSASAGEPAPFDDFQGSDFGDAFSATWTFNFAPLSEISDAFLRLGFYDHDSQAPGSQVASFSLDGNDLTSLLDAAFESHGGDQAQYNIYEIALPDSVFADLEDGVATFNLTLAGPGLQENPGGSPTTTSSNGAGLDFATLDVMTEETSVPEPTSLLSLLVLGVLGGVSTRRKGKIQ